MSQVLFFSGTQAQYDALAQKNTDALYFTTDTRRIYRGANAYSLPVQIVDSFPVCGVDGTIYAAPSIHEIRLYAGRWWNLQDERECTSFKVLANNVPIPAGSTEYLEIPLTAETGSGENLTAYPTAVEIPAGMTHEFSAKASAGQVVVVDWGDGTVESFDFRGETEAGCPGPTIHTYGVPGIYVIRIYGEVFRVVSSKQRNLIYRAFDLDCRLGRHLTSLQEFCQGALRLVQVKAEDWGMTQVKSLRDTFSGCKNLRIVTGFGRLDALVTCSGAFRDCWNMFSCDFRLPPQVLASNGSSDAYRNIFYSSENVTWALTGKLLDFFPQTGFSGNRVDLSQLFYNYRSNVRFPNLTLNEAEAEKLSRILWNDITKTFQYRSPSDETGGTSGIFRCFTQEVRSLIPVAWGGTNSEIEVPLPAFAAGQWQTIA